MKLSKEFLVLLNAALSGKNPEGGEIDILTSASPDDWQRIAAISREQNVTGLVGDAVTNLPEKIAIPDNIFLYFLAEKEKCAIQGRRMAAIAKSVIHGFNDAGLNPILMKGPATAAFYPKPELRTFGDIDLFFYHDEFHKARDIAKSESGFMLASDGSFHFKKDDVDVDVHDGYFDLHISEENLPKVPSAEATLLMLSAHALKHACGTGVGIRQITDYAMACDALKGQYDPDKLDAAFKESGIIKWQSLLSSFIINILGIQIPCPGGKTISEEPLLKIIEEGGNFGHHAAGRSIVYGKSATKRKMDTFRRFLRRLPFSLKYAPKETFRTMLSLLGGNLHI
ncbi:MAG: nucleotidyltransferase family protein [Bacteroidales bacterium]|nr:nucleotidyltransferase family protein [Bacteroidales bacterium]